MREPLDFVLTLADLRRPGVDFTERVPVEGGEGYPLTRARSGYARLTLAAKAARLRDGSDNPNDPEDLTRFVREMLDAPEMGSPQAVANTLVGLTFTAQYRRRVQ